MSAPRLPIGVALGTIGLDAPEWLGLAARIAALPVDRLWIWDHLQGRGAADTPVLEALTLTGAALAANPGLRVGTLVLDVTKRHPAVAAKSVATLASMAPGRFALGIGAGGDAAEHEAFGIPYGTADERLAALGEAVGIARALLTGDPTVRVDRPGEPRLRAAASSPRPVPPVEIVVAGDHPRSIGLAAREADGWVAADAHFDAGLALLRRAAAESGRRAGEPRAYLLVELRRDEALAAGPFCTDPVAWSASVGGRGADAAIVTVRSAGDVEALGAALARLLG